MKQHIKTSNMYHQNLIQENELKSYFFESISSVKYAIQNSNHILTSVFQSVSLDLLKSILFQKSRVYSMSHTTDVYFFC